MKAIRLAILLACSGAGAQSEGPTFEVATIRPAAPMQQTAGPGRMFFMGCRGGPGTSDPGRYTCQNMTLFALVTQAYDLRAYQVFGPDWTKNERFDIAAKIPEGATKEQFRVMI